MRCEACGKGTIVKKEEGKDYECDKCGKEMTAGMYSMKKNIRKNQDNKRRMAEDMKKANKSVKRSHRLGKD
jgi:ribosomal protein L37AE/L43A